jgi:ribosome-binding protein aMBF1 (putative translation factor)
VVKLLTDMVSKSPANDSDRVAVLHYIAEDWRNARVLASMASSLTVSADADFPIKLQELIAATGLSVSAWCKQNNLLQSSIQSYTSGKSRPTWDMVQKIANALGVSTDVFRDPNPEDHPT